MNLHTGHEWICLSGEHHMDTWEGMGTSNQGE